MPNVFYTNEEWLEIFRQCRTSGKSDYQWCYENHIPSSSFYRHLRKAINSGMTEQIKPTEEISGTQDVVELRFPETSVSEPPALPKPELFTKAPDAFTVATAARITVNGIRIELTNHADADLIRNTISALQKLC